MSAFELQYVVCLSLYQLFFICSAVSFSVHSCFYSKRLRHWMACLCADVPLIRECDYTHLLVCVG